MEENQKVCRIGQIVQAIHRIAWQRAKNAEGFDQASHNKLGLCIGPRCALWKVLYPEYKREAHDGGKEYVMQLAYETGRKAYFIYPHWIVDEGGCCGLIK
jgi:hypothetical protein